MIRMPQFLDLDKFKVNSTTAMINALFIFIVTKCHCSVKMYDNSKAHIRIILIELMKKVDDVLHFHP